MRSSQRLYHWLSARGCCLPPLGCGSEPLSWPADSQSSQTSQPAMVRQAPLEAPAAASPARYPVPAQAQFEYVMYNHHDNFVPSSSSASGFNSLGIRTAQGVHYGAVVGMNGNRRCLPSPQPLALDFPVTGPSQRYSSAMTPPQAVASSYPPYVGMQCGPSTEIASPPLRYHYPTPQHQQQPPPPAGPGAWGYNDTLSPIPPQHILNNRVAPSSGRYSSIPRQFAHNEQAYPGYMLSPNATSSPSTPSQYESTPTPMQPNYEMWSYYCSASLSSGSALTPQAPQHSITHHGGYDYGHGESLDTASSSSNLANDMAFSKYF
ncbi:hypothetical protein HGRIS_005338 [Hohenbuehelia grisea]|uniref:Uncharacterized protein n=1 Tax=Hohenbuehelia grisea TaxID=104357 RepID=A0ABR3JER9_9AGAR